MKLKNTSFLTFFHLKVKNEIFIIQKVFLHKLNFIIKHYYYIKIYYLTYITFYKLV